MKKALCVVAFIFLPSFVFGQTLNPTKVEFTASADHNTVENSVAILTSYEVRIFQVDGTTLVRSQDIGKPTPGAGNLITASIATTIAQLPVGNYVGRIAAKGPGGEGVTAPSDPFPIVVRAPTAPTNPAFTK